MRKTDLEKIAEAVTWWPLGLADKLPKGAWRFAGTMLACTVAIPCVLSAIPFWMLVAFEDIWRSSSE